MIEDHLWDTYRDVVEKNIPEREKAVDSALRHFITLKDYNFGGKSNSYTLKEENARLCGEEQEVGACRGQQEEEQKSVRSIWRKAQ